jgi:hypothetical protein
MKPFSVTVLAVVVTTTVAGCGGIVKANGDGSTGAGPTIASISPDRGAVTGGTSVSITGTNFLAGALVFFGTARAQTVRVSSGTQIRAVTPPPSAIETVDVLVQNPDNRSAKLVAAFTYDPSYGGAPTISAISPNSGPSGTQVTITGTNFESAATVAFGNTNASVTFVSATELQVIVPIVASGTYDVTVTNPDPGSATLNGGFTVITSPPNDTSLIISPSSGSCVAGGTLSFIARGNVTGTDFTAVSVWVSQALGIAAPTTPAGTFHCLAVGATTISATKGALHGTASVTVITPPPDDTSLIILPSDGSCLVGEIASFTAKGNVSGTDYTAQATWSSQNSTIASQTTPNGAFSCVAAGTTTISASRQGIHGTATLNVNNLGTDSLLAGKTPANFTVPAGWTALLADGFETGDYSKWSWTCCSGTPGSIFINSNAAFNHSGGFSAGMHYVIPSSQQGEVDNDMRPGLTVNPQTHVYVSGWVYFHNNGTNVNTTDPNGIARKLYYIKSLNGSGSQTFWFILGVWAFPGDTSPGVFVPSWSPDNLSASIDYLSQGLHWDRWYQVELEIQESTPGEFNGFYNLYLDGQLVNRHTSIRTRASQYTNGVNDIEIGNQVNRFASVNIDEYRYWDDVIILKK